MKRKVGRPVKLYRIEGVEKTLQQWCEHFGVVSFAAAKYRLYMQKWPLLDAVSKPRVDPSQAMIERHQRWGDTRVRGNRLSRRQVIAIRQDEHRGKTQEEIGRIYGVSRQTINGILRGRTWKGPNRGLSDDATRILPVAPVRPPVDLDAPPKQSNSGK